MGGLMSLFAVSEFNHVFSRAAALSPAVWAGNGRLEGLIRKTSFSPDTVVYMDYGSEEAKGQERTTEAFWRCAGALSDRGVFVTARVVPGGTHCEACWEKQIPVFMPILTYNNERSDPL